MPSFAVIGGEGFLGHAIVLALTAQYPGCTILSLDLEQRHYPSKSQWSFQNVDLCSLPSLSSALSSHNIDSVFHTASPWIHSTREVCEKVNVEGTKTVVTACKQAGVRKLVYTSSAGIVFEAADLVNVDERLEARSEKAVGPYNDTKARAEHVVLSANGEDGLLTCAIRPAGIFGPGDRQAIPGCIGAYKGGKHKVMLGSNNNLVDFTYIDNVVHAHMLAVAKLDTSVPVSVFASRLTPTKGTLKTRPLPTSLTSTPEAEWTALEKQLANDSERDAELPAVRNRFDQWFEVASSGVEQSEGGASEPSIPVAGQAFYISNGEPLPFWSFARFIWYLYASHSKAMWSLPPDVGLLYASVGDAIAKLRGKKSAFPKSAVYYSFSTRYYNIEKARKMLRYEPLVGLEEGLKLGVQWYKENEKSVEAGLAAQAKNAKA